MISAALNRITALKLTSGEASHRVLVHILPTMEHATLSGIQLEDLKAAPVTIYNNDKKTIFIHNKENKYFLLIN